MSKDISEKDIHDAVDYLYIHGRKFAEAKAQRQYLEEFRKSKKAMIMRQAKAAGLAKTSAEAEMIAYADESYMQLLMGIKEAVEREEEIRWGLVAAQARIDVWRSTEASNRVMDRVTL
jgi:protoporphyrinogen oxidase